MRTGLIAYKMGMTRVFDENNKHVPVTVLKIDNCKVIDVKTMDRDGYTSVQLGAGLRKENKISKSLRFLSIRIWVLGMDFSNLFQVGNNCKYIAPLDRILVLRF